MAVRYDSRTGVMSLPDGTVFQCYSGHEEGVNDPDLEAHPGIGPIPVGEWTMLGWATDNDTGPKSILLQPNGHDAHGRCGFRIHGDNSEVNRTGSHGCIVHSPAADREKIFAAGPELTVYASIVPAPPT